MPKVILTQQLAKAIWDDHAEVNPRAGQQFTEWVTATAEKHGVSTTIVRTAIARETQAFAIQVAQKRATTAQHVAQQMGVTMVDVLRTIRQSLAATRKEVLYEESIVAVDEPEDSTEEHERKVTGENGFDDSGVRTKKTARKRHVKLRQPMRRADGSFEYFEQPDWKARLMGTQQLIDVIGMQAPEQLEVNVEGNVNIRNLTQEEIYRELRATAEQLKSLGVAGLLEGTEGGSASAPSRAVSGVLVDVVHEDQGRAGQDRRSLQTVSEEAIHRAGRRRAGKRTRGVSGEEPHHDGQLDGQRVGGTPDVHPAGDGSDLPV